MLGQKRVMKGDTRASCITFVCVCVCVCVRARICVFVLYTTAVVFSQAGWLTLHSNHIIQSLNRRTIGQAGSHDNYDRTPALFLLPVCVCVSAARF